MCICFQFSFCWLSLSPGSYAESSVLQWTAFEVSWLPAWRRSCYPICCPTIVGARTETKSALSPPDFPDLHRANSCHRHRRHRTDIKSSPAPLCADQIQPVPDSDAWILNPNCQRHPHNTAACSRHSQMPLSKHHFVHPLHYWLRGILGEKGGTIWQN